MAAVTVALKLSNHSVHVLHTLIYSIIFKYNFFKYSY